MDAKQTDRNQKYIQRSTYIIIGYGILHIILALTFVNDENFSGAPAGEIVIWTLIALLSYASYRFLSLTAGIITLIMLLIQIFAMIGVHLHREAIIDLILTVVFITTLFRIYKQKQYIKNMQGTSTNP